MFVVVLQSESQLSRPGLPTPMPQTEDQHLDPTQVGGETYSEVPGGVDPNQSRPAPPPPPDGE